MSDVMAWMRRKANPRPLSISLRRVLPVVAILATVLAGTTILGAADRRCLGVGGDECAGPGRREGGTIDHTGAVQSGTGTDKRERH